MSPGLDFLGKLHASYKPIIKEIVSYQDYSVSSDRNISDTDELGVTQVQVKKRSREENSSDSDTVILY
jgi:hypothetical protein